MNIFFVKGAEKNLSFFYDKFFEEPERGALRLWMKVLWKVCEGGRASNYSPKLVLEVDEGGGCGQPLHNGLGQARVGGLGQTISKLNEQ